MFDERLVSAKRIQDYSRSFFYDEIKIMFYRVVDFFSSFGHLKWIALQARIKRGNEFDSKWDQFDATAGKHEQRVLLCEYS